MGLFNDSLLDVIRCDETEYLVWKWTPEGQAPDSHRESSIRWGSSLRVNQSSVAVFMYTKNNGIMMDYIEGPVDKLVQTLNFPVLSDLIGLAYRGDSPFQAEVYFINLANVIQLNFGVPFFDIYDPRFLDFGVPIAIRGTITFHISDYRHFVQLHRLRNFNLNELETKIKSAITKYVKSAVTNAPSTFNIPVIQIERKIIEINESIQPAITKRLHDEFGINVTSIDIAAIEIDKNSQGYHQLMAVTKNITSSRIKAENEINIKDLKDMQQIKAHDLEQNLKLSREEKQYTLHKETQTNNFAAYQMEVQEHMGVAGAEGLGKMGSGGSSNSMNPATIMAGMAVGGVLGQNIAGTMQSVMNATPQVSKPPIIPKTVYHIAVNEQPTGPYTIETLQKMATTGQFTKESLIWTDGMNTWEKACNVNALSSLFPKTPPIPTTK